MKIKNVVLILSILLNISFSAYFAKQWYEKRNARPFFDSGRYADENVSTKQLGPQYRQVVFIGNSITENWVHLRTPFFADNGYICRGIVGNTSPQLLLRFRSDVVDLQPQIVVITIGVNDIGEVDGFYDPDFVLNNIKSMVEIARANNIEVVLTSVLPVEKLASRFKTIDDAAQKVDALNSEIKKYADENNINYVDYNSSLRNSVGGLDARFTFDGLHPNEEGYKIMEQLIKKELGKLSDMYLIIN